MANPRKFLTAVWQNIVMANFPVDPGILKPYVPAGTILDEYQGTTYVSVVGFEFLQTKVFRLPIPMHRDFEEINLRFYVRRQYENEIRLGVVFIKEIVPRLAIALVARGIYEEPYVSMPTRCKIESPGENKEGKFLYEWEFKDQWCHLSANVQGSSKSIEKKIAGGVHYSSRMGLQQTIGWHHNGIPR